MPGRDLPKHLYRPLLGLPSYKGEKLLKVVRFVDDTFELNPGHSHLEQTGEMRNAVGFFSYKIIPKHHQAYMREFKKHEGQVIERCAANGRRRQEEQDRKDAEQGAFDKPLRRPDVSKMEFGQITYSWYATKLQDLNPDQIITKEMADRELESMVRHRMPKNGSGASRGVTQDGLCARFKKEAKKYWDRRTADEAEDEDES